MKTRCYILLGGFIGADGYLTSAGMYALKPMLEAIPNVERVSVYQWGAYRACADEIIARPGRRTALIGYSGGGTRALWLARDYPQVSVDLMVLYDPSPSWQMVPAGHNVRRALSYHNTAPFFFGLGGGVLSGINVESVDIAENHMIVQSDLSLHRQTVAEVSALAAKQ